MSRNSDFNMKILEEKDAYYVSDSNNVAWGSNYAAELSKKFNLTET